MKIKKIDIYQKALDLLPENKFVDSVCYFFVMLDYILWAFRWMNMKQKEQWEFNLFLSADYDQKWGDFTVSYSKPTFDDHWGMFDPPDYPVAEIFAWIIFVFHFVLFAAIAVVIYG